MRNNKKIIGAVKCPECGFKNIYEPESITIWYAEEDTLQRVETVCPECGDTVIGRLNEQEQLFFKKISGVNWLRFGDQFEPLTEAIIASWDANSELSELSD